MLALVGPRANGRTKKLAQWALASGGVIVVASVNRAELLQNVYHVPREQIATIWALRDRAFGGQDRLTLYAIDDVDHVLQDLLSLNSTPQLVTFHGGAMQP